MRPNRLVLRGLTYYWRTNVAVVLGVATAVAVLAGALLVGDSVRGSLRDLVLQRLGRTDLVVASATFFRAQLADDIRTHPAFDVHIQRCGSADRRAGLRHRAGKRTPRRPGPRLWHRRSILAVSRRERDGGSARARRARQSRSCARHRCPGRQRDARTRPAPVGDSAGVAARPQRGPGQHTPPDGSRSDPCRRRLASSRWKRSRARSAPCSCPCRVFRTSSISATA